MATMNDLVRFWARLAALTCGLMVAVATAQAGQSFGQWPTIDRADGLRSDNVSCMVCDSSGRFWIGTDSGLCSYQPREGRIRKGDSLTFYGDRENLASNIVQCLLLYDHDVLAIGTESGLSLGTHLGQEVPTFKFTFPGTEDLKNKSVQALVRDTDGALWIGTNDGLYVLRNGKLTSQQFIESARNVVTLNVLSIAVGQDVVWIGTYGHGLFKFSKTETDPVKRFTMIVRESEGFFPSDDIRAVLLDSTGALWVSEWGHGVIRYDIHGNSTHYGHAQGFPGLAIQCLFIDSEQHLWMGTEGGVCRSEGSIEQLPLKFEFFTKNRDQIMGGAIRAIVEQKSDGHSTYWIGGSNGFCTFGGKLFTPPD